MPPSARDAPHHRAAAALPSLASLPRLRIPGLTTSPVSSSSSSFVSSTQNEYHQHQTVGAHASRALPRPQTPTYAAWDRKTPSNSSSGLSPSSPASFTEHPAAQFGLVHLLEAAQQCQALPTTRDVTDRLNVSIGIKRPRTDTGGSVLPSQNRLHSIQFLINGHDDEAQANKRPRPDHTTLGLPSLTVPSSYHDDVPQSQYVLPTPVHRQLTDPQITPTALRDEICAHQASTAPASDGQTVDARNVWETVLETDQFPEEISLNESQTGCSKAVDVSNSTVHKGRWTDEEKEFAEALIQQVRRGEVALPPNVSLRKFIADSLQCKAMRVSKKFRSLGGPSSPASSSCSSSSGDEPRFNALSLSCIMNDDSTGSQPTSPIKKSTKTLKRSDYSQHGAVRSGRWSVEEENYAKAMIDAFKAGYLPLHGNVSLRKFLSEVLVCHPMRISKKFVGYVRKYHWYRIAAGKCDPIAKRVALERLCVLEREFWASQQQSHEWSASHPPLMS